MTDVPPRRSLVVRTGAVLALALAVSLAALFLFFRPYLEDAFRQKGAELLQRDGAQARAESLDDHEQTGALLSAGVEHAWEAARDEVADAPIELAGDDPEAVRALLDDRLARASSGTGRNLEALIAEIERRAEARQRRIDEETAAANEASAAAFGSELSFRVGTLVLTLLVLVFAVLGFLLYRGVIAPVQRLSAATREVARGELGTRIEVTSEDEVGRLAQSFNAMTAELERALGELRDLNATLEDRVQEKTAELSRALEKSRDANRRLERAMEELREKDEELRRADRMASLGTLAGGVAHEFNNLLGGILGCAEEAAREDDRAEVRATLGVIVRTARRGAAITSKLLRFARPTEGVRQELDLAAIARDVATLVEPESHRTGTDVTIVVEGDTRLVAEEAGMHQVLLNLATNALHAMEDAGGGTLTLSVRGEPSQVVVDVADTGVGIAPEDRDRLFEPFFTTRGPTGTGLGLAVSYGIVASHGGRLDVVSEPGRGSTFTVTLPRLAATQGGAVVSTQEEHA